MRKGAGHTTHKFAVSVHGCGCHVLLDDGSGNPRLRRVGFYTTRFVTAVNAEAASEEAIRLIRRELREYLKNPPDYPYTLEVEESREDPAAFDRYAPGAGFTWYEDELSY